MTLLIDSFPSGKKITQLHISLSAIGSNVKQDTEKNQRTSNMVNRAQQQRPSAPTRTSTESKKLRCSKRYKKTTTKHLLINEMIIKAHSNEKISKQEDGGDKVELHPQLDRLVDLQEQHQHREMSNNCNRWSISVNVIVDAVKCDCGVGTPTKHRFRCRPPRKTTADCIDSVRSKRTLTATSSAAYNKLSASPSWFPVLYTRSPLKFEYCFKLALCCFYFCLLCISREALSSRNFGWSQEARQHKQENYHVEPRQQSQFVMQHPSSIQNRQQFFHNQQQQQHIQHQGQPPISEMSRSIGPRQQTPIDANHNNNNYRQQFSMLPTRLIMQSPQAGTTKHKSPVINHYHQHQSPTSVGRQARQQRQINADRRQSTNNENVMSNNSNSQHSSATISSSIKSNNFNQNVMANNNNDKLLVCYYTTRDSIQHLASDTREYLIPSDSLAKLHSANQKAQQQTLLQPEMPIRANGASFEHQSSPNGGEFSANNKMKRTSGETPLINNLKTFVPSNAIPLNQNQDLLFKSSQLHSSRNVWPNQDGGKLGVINFDSNDYQEQQQVHFNGPVSSSSASSSSARSSPLTISHNSAHRANQTPAYSLIGSAGVNNFASAPAELIDLGAANSEAAIYNNARPSMAVPTLLFVGEGGTSGSSQFFAPSMRVASFIQQPSSLGPASTSATSSPTSNQVVHFANGNNNNIDNNSQQHSLHNNPLMMTAATTKTAMTNSPTTTATISADNSGQQQTNNHGATLNRLERADVISGPLKPSSISTTTSPHSTQVVFVPASSPISRGANTIIFSQEQASISSQGASASNNLGGQNARSPSAILNNKAQPIFELPDSKAQIFVPQLIVANSVTNNVGSSKLTQTSGIGTKTANHFNQHKLYPANDPQQFPTYQVLDSVSPLTSPIFVNLGKPMKTHHQQPLTEQSPTSSVEASSNNRAGSTTIFNNNQAPGVPLSAASSALLIHNSGSQQQSHATNNNNQHLLYHTPSINQSEQHLSNNKHQQWPASTARQSISGSGSPAALVSSPLSSMFDVFGAASQYLMRFKPSSFVGQPGTLQIPIGGLSGHNIPQIMEQNLSRNHNNNLQLGSSKSPITTSQNINSNTNINETSINTVNNPVTSGNLFMSPINSALGQHNDSGFNKSSQHYQHQNYTSNQFPSANAVNTAGSSFLSRLVSSSFGLSSSSAVEFQRREDVCGRTIQTPERRIIGGEGARYGEFPYQVHIKIAKHQCGGALVDRQSIVTAAHCVYHFITRAPVNKLQIVIGAYDIEDEQYQELPPQYFKVNKVKLHPNFRFSASHPDRYDVAILKLDKPVKYTDNVLPVCLPGRDLNFESMVGTVTGFGKTDPSLSNRYGTRLLQKVDVPIIENSECERWHRTRGIDLKIFPEMMCAGYEDGLKDACVGDSGGPLVVKSAIGPNGAFRWTLAGITSAGFGCAQSRQPGIYHRVSHTVDWILENLD